MLETQEEDAQCKSYNTSQFLLQCLQTLPAKTLNIHSVGVDLTKKDTDIKNSHDEMRDDSYTVSFPFFGFCGRPVESIEDVLTEGGEEAVCDLTQKQQVS